MPDISSIRVPADFESEFPGASRSAAEVAANLAQASMAFVAQVERRPHPTDRRKVLIHLTAEAQRIVDQQLPAIHAVITQAVSTLPESDREHLLASLTTIRAQLNLAASQPLPAAKPRRRPARLVAFR
jgi:hypothetical protein